MLKMRTDSKRRLFTPNNYLHCTRT